MDMRVHFPAHIRVWKQNGRVAGATTLLMVGGFRQPQKCYNANKEGRKEESVVLAVHELI